MIVADLVIDSLSAKITFDATRESNLEAKLQGKAQAFVGQDAKATFKFSRTGSGTYTLEVTQPVVLAVLPKQQKAGSPFGAAITRMDRLYNNYTEILAAGAQDCLPKDYSRYVSSELTAPLGRRPAKGSDVARSLSKRKPFQKV
jgi:hypothetical protein